MRWPMKCLVDSCKAAIPFQNELRAIKYRFVPYVPDPSNNAWTIQQGLTQIESLRTIRPLENAVVLEVGTGWQPLIPALYSLAGAGRVYLTDSRRLCQPASFEAALRSLRFHQDLILESLGIGREVFDQALNWKPAQGLTAGFERLRLEYLAPCDCQCLNLDAESLDVVTSRAVLEHIPPNTIQGILAESFRLLKRGGLACHIVDNSDHWQHSDSSISRVNFLKFPDSVFRWTYLNGLNYQNRLRHSEYVQMFSRVGFTMLREEPDIDAGSLAILDTLPLAERFRGFSSTDLATVNSFLLASKPTSGKDQPA